MLAEIARYRTGSFGMDTKNNISYKVYAICACSHMRDQQVFRNLFVEYSVLSDGRSATKY